MPNAGETGVEFSKRLVPHRQNVVDQILSGGSGAVGSEPGAKDQSPLHYRQRIDPHHDQGEVVCRDFLAGLGSDRVRRREIPQRQTTPRFGFLNNQAELWVPVLEMLHHKIAGGILAWESEEHQIPREARLEFRTDRYRDGATRRSETDGLRNLGGSLKVPNRGRAPYVLDGFEAAEFLIGRRQHYVEGLVGVKAKKATVTAQSTAVPRRRDKPGQPNEPEDTRYDGRCVRCRHSAADLLSSS
jgi:hypothetical protein